MSTYWNVISLNEPNAKMKFKKHRGEIKFMPMDYYFMLSSEDEIVFSRAIAKFQNLVRFEE